MTLEYRTDFPAIDQFWELYQTTGWNDNYRLSPEVLERAIRASRFVISAYDGGQLVGFGRVVSDGALHAMIYEMIVAPDHQGWGIGARILQQLVQHCREAGIRDIQLFCARGKRGFYEKYGFMARPDDGPGMQYVGK
jgi:GNAT superfamily N-acetyltransferase